MTSLRGRPFNMSLDDYSRVMLEYTLRQLAAFIDVDPGDRHNSVGSSSSSGSSKTSGRSNTSTVGVSAKSKEDVFFSQGAYAHKELPQLGPLMKTPDGKPGFLFRAYNKVE
ncbi:hypothetical protein M432DRAFT_638394 [Thermoascus aurantiacus ATCC 26904]